MGRLGLLDECTNGEDLVSSLAWGCEEIERKEAKVLRRSRSEGTMRDGWFADAS